MGVNMGGGDIPFQAGEILSQMQCLVHFTHPALGAERVWPRMVIPTR